MSDKGRAYVSASSPYTGTAYFIHYILGSLENPGHDHRLFTGDKWIAHEARTSVKTVQRAKAQMVADGFLEVLDASTRRGHNAEYRFLFPARPVDILTTGLPVDTVDISARPVDISARPVDIGDNRTSLIETSIKQVDGRRAPKATVLPDGFTVTDDMLTWAQDNGLGSLNLRTETEKFKDHALAKGATYVNWQAAWRTWVRNAVTFSQPRGRPASNSRDGFDAMLNKVRAKQGLGPITDPYVPGGH